LGTAFAQVVQQRGRDLVSQGQPQHAAGLALPDAEASGSPLHVIQREAHDLAGSQPIRGDQEKDCIVATAARRRAINRPQKCLHDLPRQCPRKPLLSVDPRCVDLPVETHRGLASGRRKPQEAAQVADHLLERASAKSLAAATDEGVDFVDGQGAETQWMPLVTDMHQQGSGRVAMALDRRARQPANLLQILREGRHVVLDLSTRSGRIQRGLGLEIAFQQPHGGREPLVVRVPKILTTSFPEILATSR
jgi:hypothetical protein